MLAFSALGVEQGRMGRERERHDDASPRTSCSVVVCCHNESNHIEHLHAEVSKAVSRALERGHQIEVLAVNHGSTDDTLQRLQNVAKDDPTWRVVDLERTRSSKKEALAFGVDQSQGQVLLLTDADCTPVSEDWVLHMVQGAAEGWDVHVGLSFPSPTSSETQSRWLRRLQRLEARRVAQRTVGAIDVGKPYMAFGRNLAFTREIWEQVGGFDNHRHLPSGDDDLWMQEAYAYGARVHVSTHKESQTKSTWPDSWRAWRLQKPGISRQALCTLGPFASP